MMKKINAFLPPEILKIWSEPESLLLRGKFVLEVDNGFGELRVERVDSAQRLDGR
jgi:hypothetical protein